MSIHINGATVQAMGQVAAALQTLIEGLDMDTPFYLSPVVLMDQDGEPLASFWDEDENVVGIVHSSGKERTEMRDLVTKMIDLTEGIAR